MYGLYYASSVLYFVAGAVVSPLVTLFLWLTVAQAAHRRLARSLRWLTPLAVGHTLSTLAVLVMVLEAVGRLRSVALVVMAYGLYVVACAFILPAIVRLWKTFRDLPTSAGTQPPAAAGQEQPGVWPPPPDASQKTAAPVAFRQ